MSAFVWVFCFLLSFLRFSIRWSLNMKVKGKCSIVRNVNKNGSWSLLDVFGDGFGSFWDCVSCQLSGKDELDCWLDFPWWESSSLVESNQLWSFSGDSVEGVVDEWVHDVHGFLGDSNVGVDLLEDFVDVDGEGLDSSSSGFLVGVLGSGLSWFLSH